MSLFDTLIVQPIFNLLAIIYGVLPGGDFGVSLILFTILVRLALWPLLRKQLHQTKLLRALQPELKKIKAKAKGNRQQESQLMMELYRERGVKPFSSFGLLFLQLPIFIGLYRVIQIITLHRDQIAKYTYDFVEQLKPIADIIHSSTHQFDESLLHLVNLTRPALSSDGIYWPLLVVAALAACLQYIQSRQITPRSEGNKKLRDIFRDSAAGKEVDQSEVSAIMGSRMIILFPFLTFTVGIYLPGALVLYYAASSATAIIQQYFILHRDVEEMEAIADMDTSSTKQTTSETKQRAANAQEAVVTSSLKKKSKRKKRRR
jgi:YidC/Oxa1 family membrane protein insertase